MGRTQFLEKLQVSLQPLVEILEIPFAVDNMTLGKSGISEAKSDYLSRPYAKSNHMNDEMEDTIYACFGEDTPIPERYEADGFGFLFTELLSERGIYHIAIQEPPLACSGQLHVGDLSSTVLNLFQFLKTAPIGDLEWALLNRAPLYYRGYEASGYNSKCCLGFYKAEVDGIDGTIHSIILGEKAE